MPETQFIESEAMLLAVRCDGECEGEAFDALIAYLAENFLPGELRRLVHHADVLVQAAPHARRIAELRGGRDA